MEEDHLDARFIYKTMLPPATSGSEKNSGVVAETSIRSSVEAHGALYICVYIYLRRHVLQLTWLYLCESSEETETDGRLRPFKGRQARPS